MGRNFLLLPKETTVIKTKIKESTNTINDLLIMLIKGINLFDSKPTFVIYFTTFVLSIK